MFDYLTGIYNITPTPFTPDGALDEPSLRRLTEFTRGTGVNGMTILGVLGEADKLTERERKIIVLRFGLDDGRFRTLEEVGREFGITRERIRQIEAKALRKLRHPSYSRKLRGYLE